MGKDIKIMVVCHKKAVTAKNDYLYPIQVGTSTSEEYFEDMLHDNMGENISNLNKYYAELTAQYWAWKNLDAEYYGLFHYRRYFSFRLVEMEKECWTDEKGLPVYDRFYNRITDKALAEIHLDEKRMESIISGYDLIAPIPDEMEMTVYQQYKESAFHRIEDLDAAEDVIIELYPDYITDMHEYLNSKKAYFCNMFIMKKEIFKEYSQWLFAILEEVLKRRNYENYNIGEQRALAFLAERLFGIFYTHACRSGNLKILELQRVVWKNTNPFPEVKKKAGSNYVPLVLACDNSYVRHAATVILSAAQNLSAGYLLDVLILERGIKQNSRKLLKRTLEKYQNVSVRYVDMGYMDNQILDENLPSHYPAEISYRLAASYVLDEYDKFLYLDCDTLVLGNLAELFELDLEDKVWGMAKDLDFLAHCRKEKAWRKYARNKLGIEIGMPCYQSGVMIFNAKRMRETFKLKDLMDMLVKNKYRFVDQDVLNVIGKGFVKEIDLEWNYQADYRDGEFARKKDLMAYVSTKEYEKYLNAEKNAKIVHYCIPIHLRPWFNPNIIYGYEYWSVVRKSCFFEIILADMARGENVRSEIAVPTRKENDNFSLIGNDFIKIRGMDELINIESVQIKLIKFMSRIFPMNSKRREAARKLGRKVLR